MIRRFALFFASCLFAAATVMQSAASAAGVGGHNSLVAFNRAQDIYTMTASGTGLKRLTTGGQSSHPHWSPDGKRIVYQQAGYLWIMNSDGSHKYRLVHGLGASWSPDGTHIAYVNAACGGYGSLLYDISASTPHSRPIPLIQCTPDGYDTASGQTSWKPDGSSIAYTDFYTDQYGSADNTIISVRVAAPHRQHVVLANIGCTVDGGTLPCPNRVTNLGLAYSRNGSSVAFVTDWPITSHRKFDGRSRLYVVSSDGKSVHQLSSATNVSTPSWSPDGTAVYFSHLAPDGSWQIWKTSSSTGSSTAATIWLNQASQPDWQPVP